MKTVLCSALFSLVLASSLAGQERSPVRGPQRIAGREVARFVVAQAIPFQSVAFDPSHRWTATVTVIPAGQYIPVSEDRDAVYFQSTTGMGGMLETEGKYSPGGLYVSKQRLGEVHAVFGDARGSGRLLRSQLMLAPEAQRKLLVAQVDQGRSMAKAGKP